jgi:hypothetical protein
MIDALTGLGVTIVSTVEVTTSSASAKSSWTGSSARS